MKLIIFDFDGTIADTFGFVPKIVNTIAPEFGYKKFTNKEIEELRLKSAAQIMKIYKVSIFKLPRILARAKEEATKEIKRAKSFLGLNDVIKDLGKEYQLAIISSNSSENIMTFLKNNGLKFDVVITEKSLFGKAKIIRKLLKEQKLKPTDAVYVGDEIRDIEEANKAGIKVISVSWGYNKKEVLEKRNKLIADRPEDIPQLINEIS